LKERRRYHLYELLNGCRHERERNWGVEARIFTLLLPPKVRLILEWNEPEKSHNSSRDEDPVLSYEPWQGWLVVSVTARKT